MDPRRTVEIVAGDKVIAKIALTMRAMLAFQRDQGQTILDALAEMEDGSFDPVKLVALFRHMVQGEAISENDACDMMDRIGLVDCANRISEAVKLAFPEQGDRPGKP